MEQPLKGKVALITGGTRGIGRAISRGLALRGANLVLNYVRNEETAAETEAEIRKLGVETLTVQANVGDPAAVDAMVARAVETFGGVDILIHNAALGAFKPLHLIKSNQWDLSMNVNAKAFLHLVQKTLPFMEARGGGSIVALSSLGSHRYIPQYGAIGVSKAAVESMVRHLAVELAPRGVRVNAVSGGLVDTEALKYFPRFDEFKQEVVRRTPAGRIGEPDDLARVAVFLVLPESSWIVGQTVVADGGLSLI